MAGPRKKSTWSHPGESKTSARRVRTTERQAEAVALRKEGFTLEQIGERLGIRKQTAHELIQTAMARMVEQTREGIEELRMMELMRLEELHHAYRPHALSGDDKAAGVVLKASERRAKLMGLDAATKTELGGPGGAPLVAGVFAIPQQAPSVQEWTAQATAQKQLPSQQTPEQEPALAPAAVQPQAPEDLSGK